MSVLFLVVIVVLLIWVVWTHERYTDPTIRERRTDESARDARERAQQAVVYRSEADFWSHRAAEASSPETRAVAENLAAHHRRLAGELERRADRQPSS